MKFLSKSGKIHQQLGCVCLCSLFSFEFPALEVPLSKFTVISKYFFLFHTLSYKSLGNIFALGIIWLERFQFKWCRSDADKLICLGTGGAMLSHFQVQVCFQIQIFCTNV